MTIRRVLVLCALAAVVGSAPILSAQAPTVDKKEQEKRNKNQQEDVTALVQLVDTASAASPAGAAADQRQGVGITWKSNHFIKGQDGSTYVPFTMVVDRAGLSSPNAAMYIRAVAKGAAAAAPAAPAAAADKGNDKDKAPVARPIYPWDNAYFVKVNPDGVMQRALQLPGGEYDLFIAIKDQATGDKKQVAKTGLLHRTLVVPNFKGTELATSSIMVGSVEPIAQALSPQQQQENPYTFGTMKIVPLETPQIAKSGELNLIFWIYNTQLDPLTRKPNVTVEYSFNQKMGDTEKYFNKTAPQDLNATTLPPEFDLAAGHQLPGSLAVPLASFPAGDYRLEIKVTDKASGKVLTQNVIFTVNAA